MIDVVRVSVTFQTRRGPVHAVNDVSFHIAENEVFGIVGESVSGKTTLMRTMIGQLPATAGQVSIDGEMVSRRAPSSFRHKVQVVMKDCYGSLTRGQTVDQIIGEPLAIHRFAKHEERTVTTLDEVGLSTSHRFRYPHQLSGGQRHRVAIARCIAIEPRMIFLDGPTSALDVSIQAEVVNLIMDLRTKRGLILVMVSHDLALLAHMCDRLAVMHQGKVCEAITSAALRGQDFSSEHTRTLVAASRPETSDT